MVDTRRFTRSRYTNVEQFTQMVRDLGKGIDPQDGILLTIDAVVVEEVFDRQEMKKIEKLVVYCERMDQGVIVGSHTAGEALRQATGEYDSEKMRGKKVILHVHREKRSQDALRFRAAPPDSFPDSRPLGQVGANALKQRFTAAGITFEILVGWARKHDEKLHDAIHDREMVDWPAWTLEPLKRAFYALTQKGDADGPGADQERPQAGG